MSIKEVQNNMRKLGNFPVLGNRGSLKEALDLMTASKIGMICIVDTNNVLVGVLSDGDLRRILLSKQSPLPALLVSDALEFGTTEPITCQPKTSLEVAISMMKEKQIWDLPVLDENKKLLGLVHLHDIF